MSPSHCPICSHQNAGNIPYDNYTLRSIGPSYYTFIFLFTKPFQYISSCIILTFRCLTDGYRSDSHGARTLPCVTPTPSTASHALLLSWNSIVRTNLTITLHDTSIYEINLSRLSNFGSIGMNLLSHLYWHDSNTSRKSDNKGFLKSVSSQCTITHPRF